MEEISKKAQIVVELLKRLGATNADGKTNIYAILEKLEETDLKTILPNEDEYELDCIRCEMSQKSVSTTLAGLVRKGIVYKTGVNATKVNDKMVNLRSYYLV